ncbi:hypothetical protein L9F63_009734, partial [Diploptera punctata]
VTGHGSTGCHSITMTTAMSLCRVSDCLLFLVIGKEGVVIYWEVSTRYDRFNVSRTVELWRGKRVPNPHDGHIRWLAISRLGTKISPPSLSGGNKFPSTHTTGVSNLFPIIPDSLNANLNTVYNDHLYTIPKNSFSIVSAVEVFTWNTCSRFLTVVFLSGFETSNYIWDFMHHEMEIISPY